MPYFPETSTLCQEVRKSITPLCTARLGGWDGGQEGEEGPSKVAKQTAAAEQVAPGLLSKAFSRQHTVSLHNLLDRPVRSYLPRDPSPQVAPSSVLTNMGRFKDIFPVWTM
jgi:hypothetical protein